MRSITAFIVALCLLTGCGVEPKDTYTRVRSDRSPLIEGFLSYATRVEVEGQLKKDGIQYLIGATNSLSPNDFRPTYEVIEITVKKFTHLNQTGELHLTFFNNRLSDTWFFPTNPDAYITALRNAGIEVSEHRTSIGNTVMWTSQAFGSRRYVGWADYRLDEEHSKWIANYS